MIDTVKLSLAFGFKSSFLTQSTMIQSFFTALVLAFVIVDFVSIYYNYIYCINIYGGSSGANYLNEDSGIFPHNVWLLFLLITEVTVSVQVLISGRRVAMVVAVEDMEGDTLLEPTSTATAQLNTKKQREIKALAYDHAVKVDAEASNTLPNTTIVSVPSSEPDTISNMVQAPASTTANNGKRKIRNSIKKHKTSTNIHVQLSNKLMTLSIYMLISSLFILATIICNHLFEVVYYNTSATTFPHSFMLATAIFNNGPYFLVSVSTWMEIRAVEQSLQMS